MLLIGMVILTPAIWLVNRPKPYLLAVIYALIFSGIYSIDHSLFDLGIVLAAGVLGYVMRIFGFPFLPLVLALVLGYLIESNYRRSLLLTARRYDPKPIRHVRKIANKQKKKENRHGFAENPPRHLRTDRRADPPERRAATAEDRHRRSS